MKHAANKFAVTSPRQPERFKLGQRINELIGLGIVKYYKSLKDFKERHGQTK